mgnify:FL=1
MQNARTFSRILRGLWGLAPEQNEAESFDSITNDTLLPIRLEMLREALYDLNPIRKEEVC